MMKNKEFLLHEIDSVNELKRIIKEKSGLLIENQLYSCKGYLLNHKNTSIINPIGILNGGNGILPVIVIESSKVIIGNDDILTFIYSDHQIQLKLDSIIYEIHILHFINTVIIICEANVYSIDADGVINWNTSFDILSDWEFKNNLTDLDITDTNGNKYSLCLSTGKINSTCVGLDKTEKEQMY